MKAGRDDGGGNRQTSINYIGHVTVERAFSTSGYRTRAIRMEYYTHCVGRILAAAHKLTAVAHLFSVKAVVDSQLLTGFQRQSSSVQRPWSALRYRAGGLLQGPERHTHTGWPDTAGRSDDVCNSAYGLTIS